MINETSIRPAGATTRQVVRAPTREVVRRHSGLGRSAQEKITYLDPTGTSVADHGFVYVPAPRSIDRVVWHSPQGDVELKEYTLAPAKTWHLFAGFVKGPTKGGEAIGYEGKREKLRSRVLPY